MTTADFGRHGRRWAARYIPEIGVVEWRLQEAPNQEWSEIIHATALRDASDGDGLLTEALRYPWAWCYQN